MKPVNPHIIYDIFKIVIRGLPKPVGISVDITSQCNLKCKHCYFIRENYQTDLDDTVWLNTLRSIKEQYPNIIQASWCGGEPLLRQELVKKGMKYFRYNMVITNGTLPLPQWKNCIFKVSVDGTQEFHEMIRGKGTYDKIKQNVLNSNGLKIDLACIINGLNYQCIKDMIDEWKRTNVNGIHFGFLFSNTNRSTP